MTPNNKLHWSLVAGHVIECFDNTLYGFFAVMLAPIFFPSVSHEAELLASYGAFAAGFLARPIGAILFGLLGDRRGRREPLLWSMMLVGIPTLSIGLLPSYERLGLLAPFLLILCRLAQGLFMGGEFTGVNLYIAESGIRKTLGRQTGVLISSGVFGAILATAFGAFVSMQFMPVWAWRLPFIVGGFSAFSIYFCRKNLHETKDFTHARQERVLLTFPWKELIKNQKQNLATACLIAGLTIMPLYFSTIFGNRLFKDIGFTTSESMLLNMVAMIFDGILIILFGRLADKIGFYCQMMVGSLLTAIIAFPAFYIISLSPSTVHVFLFISLLVGVGCIINGCAMPYIAGLFPTNCRYSGVALSVTAGQALFGGTAPLAGSFLTDLLNTRIAPAFWLAFIALITALSIFLLQKRALKVGSQFKLVGAEA